MRRGRVVLVRRAVRDGPGQPQSPQARADGERHDRGGDKAERARGKVPVRGGRANVPDGRPPEAHHPVHRHHDDGPAGTDHRLLRPGRDKHHGTPFSAGFTYLFIYLSVFDTRLNAGRVSAKWLIDGAEKKNVNGDSKPHPITIAHLSSGVIASKPMPVRAQTMCTK